MSETNETESKAKIVPRHAEHSEPAPPCVPDAPGADGDNTAAVTLPVRITHGDRRNPKELTLSIYDVNGEVTEKTISLAPGADTVLSIESGQYVHFDY